MTEDGLERRVAALEQMAADYTDKVLSDDRLSAGVERLTDETAGLNTILTRVDEQQQRLSTLGRDLQRVEQSKANVEDIEIVREVAEARSVEARQQTLKRVYMTGILLTLFLLLLGSIFVDRQNGVREREKERCVGQQYASMKIQAYVESQKAIERDNTFVSEGIRTKRLKSLEDLGQAFPVPNCEDFK